MRAIFKRETHSYFSSPIGYVVIAALAALYGYYYFIIMAYGSSSYIPQVYNYMFSFSMMIIPIITMRSFTEDQKNKTDQALLTAPVNVTSIVLGKYFSCFFVFFIASTLGLLPAVAMSFFSSPAWAVVFGNYVATLLYGGAMISIGIFISSFTTSQIISAVGTFVISIMLMYIDQLSTSLSNAVLTAVVGFISFYSRYYTFTQGIFSLSGAVFFISVIAVFVFLTSRRIESRRWS